MLAVRAADDRLRAVFLFGITAFCLAITASLRAANDRTTVES
jgi:hypothetical protein